MSGFKAVLSRLVDGEELDDATMGDLMARMLDGELTDAQIAAVAVALRMKGETVGELASAARVLRSRCERVAVEAPGVLLDTCGTGGDGLGTFNVSTTCAVVTAACGVAVAKHGNRAVSSSAGSADVLEALGVRVDLSSAKVADCLRQVGISFLYAPSHHAALRHAARARRELGVRTFFNLLGPLANPAGATHQLVGVFLERWVEPLAHVLARLGVQGAWVVHAQGGLDEVSPSGPTRIAKVQDGRVTQTTVEPGDFGLEPVSIEDLRGGDAADNAGIIMEVLSGQSGAPRQAVLVNSAAALHLTGVVGSLTEGVEWAADAIDSGRAKHLLERWAAWTQSAAEAK